MGFKTIRAKLLLMVLGIVFFMSLSAVTYFSILKPVNTIQSERKVLDSLSSRLKNLQVEVNRLMTAGVNAEQPRYTQAVADFEKAFEDIDKITVLPKLNPDLEKALGVIKDIRSLSADGLTSVQTAYDTLVSEMRDAGSNLEAAPLNFNELLGVNTSDVGGKMIRLMMFKKKVDSLDYVLSIGETTINEQYVIIDREIAQDKAAASATSLAIVLVIVLATIIIAYLFSLTISKPIQSIEKTISMLKTGDLRQRATVKSKDELGRLAENLNSFLDVLTEFLGNTQKASEQNQLIKSQLGKSVGEAASSSVEIEVNTKSIKTQMEKVAGMAETSGSAVADMNGGFKRFMERIDSQSQQVEDSVSGVTQMLASIESIVRITDADRNAAQALVTESDRGRSVFETAFDRIEEINNSIDAIQEMATVIQGVAAQTNLLAMNAAIEAAHAGDVGKGFAVVADEIRKLAETSNASSNEISTTIQTVTQKIREAAESRGTTGQAFNAISEKIMTVSQSITEIYSNVSEMQTGGKQILEAMAELKKQSGDLTDESHLFEKSAENVTSTIESLKRVTGEVVTNIDEITTGLALIGESVREISGHADKVEAVGNEMDENVRRFTV
jgi:methyl-accepting chemotaxis protein